MTTRKKKDQLYNRPLGTVGDFVFDKKVAEVFPDMINRSVPAYSTVVDMVGLLAARFATPGSRCYDLGCSLGATSMAMRSAVAERDCQIIAVDNSEAMLDRFRQLVGDTAGIQLVCDDIRNIDFEDASLVALNFTLQFLPLDDRLPLLKKIHTGMLPGACLVLSEKTKFDDTDEDTFHDQMHTLFKRANGYSELEISQKRAALENVLLRETIDEHHQRLRRAGFARSFTWFQCFNFVSFVALRD